MTPRQRERLRSLLQKLRDEAVRSGPHKLEPKEGKDDDAEALAEMMQAISSSRNKGQAQQIARIDKALLKLRDAPEDYGLCEECEEEIPLKRLELMPHATLCAECQGKADPRRGVPRRKITDYSE